MPNHYHLLVRTPLGNFSRAMRRVDGVYTQRHNRLVGTDGALFRGRYKAIVVDADAYLLCVSRYIHRNPVESKRPLVEALDEWPWSSYPAYVGKAKPADWLCREPTYAMLGRRQRSRGYRAYVEAGVDEETAEFYGRQRQSPVLGDKHFRERVLAQEQPRGEVARYEYRPYHRVEGVLQAVAEHYELPVEELTHPSARGGPAALARSVAMWLCQQETGLTLAELGERFGGLQYSSVAQRIRRLRAEEGASRLEAIRGRIMTRFDP